jgi:hypothetical protein
MATVTTGEEGKIPLGFTVGFCRQLCGLRPLRRRLSFSTTSFRSTRSHCDSAEASLVSLHSDRRYQGIVKETGLT